MECLLPGISGIARAAALYPSARIMVCGADHVYGWQEGYEGIRSPAFVASAKEPRRTTVQHRGKQTSRVVLDWSSHLPERGPTSGDY